jgi:hypothetical protein
VRIFVFLHIATMFTAVAVTIGPWLLLRRVGRTGDVPAIRRTFAMALPITKFVPPLYVLGAALGVVAIFTNGFDPFQPFLLIAYVLFIIATVVGAVVTEPWLKRVALTAAESPDGAPSPAEGRPAWPGGHPVWYRHLTLPTNSLVLISVVAG